MHGPMGGPRRMMEQETSKPKRTGATLARLAQYFRPYTLALIVVALLIVASTWTQVTAPQLIGQSVDCYLMPAAAERLTDGAPAGMSFLQGGGSAGATTNCTYTTVDPAATAEENIAGLGGLILRVLGLYIGGALVSGLMFFMMTWAGQRVLRSLRVEVFRHLHRLSLTYYAENEAGSVMSRITNDTETIAQAISFTLVNVLSGALLLVWIVIKMVQLSLPYALLSMVVLPAMLVATFWFSAQARKAFRQTRLEIGRVNADLQESISGVREVQAFGREEANIESFRESNAANRDANIRAVSFTAALAPTLEALGYVAIAIVTAAGGLALLRGTDLFGTVMSLGLMVTFLAYVQRFNQPIQQISVMWASVQSAIAGAERIFGLLDTQPDVVDRPEAAAMPAIQGRVEFDHVGASYRPGIPVLRDVSFEVLPGQTTAIVGPTGAGKTTIINLIPRFYDVAEGVVRIDGRDVRDVTRATLRKQIGIVLQDTFLFSDSVINNIRFGRPEASDDEVRQAAELAHADEFIRRLPQGYDTVLGEHGAGLSQGQRQLVAIARAALANPRILILDEATSSVDTRTERQIQKALDLLLKGRTSFVIAHRLSTIRNADQVLVMRDGQIVERGKHDELLTRKGAYYELYMSQFRAEDTAQVAGNGHKSVVAAAPAAG